MILKVFKSGDRSRLYFMKSVRKPGKKNPTYEKVKCLGYLDELEKSIPDPIAYYTAEAKRLSPGKRKQSDSFTITGNMNDKYDLGEVPFRKETKDNPRIDELYYMGQSVLSVIYHELEIDQFLNNRRARWGMKANLEAIFKLLVFGRIIAPDSKYSTWLLREKFLLGNSEFSDDDVYRTFPFLDEVSNDLQVHMHKKIKERYGRDTSLMYYDVTNFFFEIDDPDEDETDADGTLVEGLRKRGCSKEHRPLPIVQMGLFMDNEGIPVSYGKFPGNNNDVTTFLPMMKRTRDEFELNKMIYVADKGMMSGTNVCNILAQRQGYIISRSARKLDAETRAWLLSDDGYSDTAEDFSNSVLADELVRQGLKPPKGMDKDGTTRTVVRRVKSRLVVASEKTSVTFDDDKKVSVRVNTRQVAFWSRKYQVKARIDRTEAIENAKRNGTVFNGHAANKYFRKESYDSETGEILKDVAHARMLDEELIKKDEELDGYYIIETNVIGTEDGEPPWEGRARFRDTDLLFELNRKVSDGDIVDMYRELWKIEESFKVTKSYLETRPMFVRKPKSIEAHILTCFVALLIIRVLEVKKLRGSIPYSKIVETLRRVYFGYLGSNVYKSMSCDQMLVDIGYSVGLDLSRKFYSKQDIRALNNATKQS
jgi:transposase